jgi:hypothetical protein
MLTKVPNLPEYISSREDENTLIVHMPFMSDRQVWTLGRCHKNTTKSSSTTDIQVYTDRNMTVEHFPTHQAVDSAVAQMSQSSSKT